MKNTKDLAKLIVECGLEGCDRRFIYKHFQHDGMIRNMIAHYCHAKREEIDKNIIPELILEINSVLTQIINYV